MRVTLGLRDSISTIRLRAVTVALALVAVLAATPSAQAQLFKTLYSFPGGAGGSNPTAGLTPDGAGNFYGTTLFGGLGTSGWGVIFKMDAQGHVTVLYSFTGGTDGAYPVGGLVRDAAGNLYGAASFGGDLSCNPPNGCGVVFKLDPAGNESVLHNFTGVPDGEGPNAVTRDAAGNLYGTTFNGGTTENNCLPAGCGTVFKIDAAGNESVLYAFTGSTDGSFPYAGVTRDPAGNLYGTTQFGGILTGKPCGPFGCGLVFKIDTSNHESVLHAFAGTDGKTPQGTLVRDAAGNLYGTTWTGGNKSYPACVQGGCGLVFKLDTTGHEQVLYGFKGGTDGANPYPGLLRDAAGNIFGTTSAGPNGGVVFKVIPTGSEKVLHTFNKGAQGTGATGTLVTSGGAFYGTTSGGGTVGFGTVYALKP